jgi:hypothetical protein
VVCPTKSFDLEGQFVADFEVNLHKAQTLPDLGYKVNRDPFRNIPYDLTHEILRYLSGDSIMALNRASWTIFSRTRSNLFWKKRLSEDMVWFWELPQFLQNCQNRAGDYKALYLWLDKRTKPLYGLTGVFMGVANRRRIWGPCAELADRYHRRLRASGETTSK